MNGGQNQTGATDRPSATDEHAAFEADLAAIEFELTARRASLECARDVREWIRHNVRPGFQG